MTTFAFSIIKIENGGNMKYTCIACSETTMGIFNKKEKALFHLLEMSERQKDVFIYKFIDSEIIYKCICFYSNSFLEICNHTIYYKNDYIIIYDYYIETNNIYNNILFEFMKRMHRTWCCIDEENHVIWINACNIV